MHHVKAKRLKLKSCDLFELIPLHNVIANVLYVPFDDFLIAFSCRFTAYHVFSHCFACFDIVLGVPLYLSGILMEN